jgi:tetratricopeptide (TPR) repeat protein
MTEGQALCGQDRFADGIKLLKEAYELDEHNTLTRAVFSNALMEQARLVAEKNWQEADQLARRAFELNPSHPLSKTVRTLILDQKREQTVGACLAQARELQAAGDLAHALSRIEEALAAYPREPRLIQIQETVRRELHAQRRQARRRDLEELRRMEREADTITDPGVKQVFGERVQILAGKYLEDEEVLAVANGLLGRLNIAAVQGKGSGRDVGQEKAQIAGTAGLPASAGDGATASVFSPATMDVSPPPASEDSRALGFIRSSLKRPLRLLLRPPSLYPRSVGKYLLRQLRPGPRAHGHSPAA